MITQKELEVTLWDAANILRGTIGSSDYKNYIVGFLFLKRLSDVFEEEAEKIERETGDHDLAWNEPDEHSFFVPEVARWARLRQLTQNIGQQLNIATAALEDTNPKLKGILPGLDFNDHRKFGSTMQQDTILEQLILHFSYLNLRQSNLAKPDVLGRAYEYLIKQFADDTGKKGGEFYTPRKVVELMIQLLDPEEGMRICDPSCGSGGMLIECAYHVEHRKQGNPRNLSLFGQEANLNTWAIAQMNMLLHNIIDFNIRKGDTIREPAFVQMGKLMLFDLVIANPPFSVNNWGDEVAVNDRFGRFCYGVPPKSRGDYAFIQHMVATLNEKGRLGVVVPHGVLFRGGSEGKIRERLLKDDLIEAVIGLAPNLLYGTGIPGAILILNRAKSEDRKTHLMFIDASQEYEPGKNQNHLRNEDIAHIVKAYRAFKDEPKYAAVVSLDEIHNNDYNLNISRYVVTTESEPKIDFTTEIRKLRELEAKGVEADQEMNEYLQALGLELY
jgi:type I restriction enzyme M protein